MRICEGLKPERVVYYFEEICKIPHGSGNTKAISDYCVAFAKAHGLEWIQDAMGNVILFKGGVKGYEDADPVILQGHMDMVCEKESGVEFDFETEGLTLFVDGDFLRAKGTTLGGDDGIALAYGLAILESSEIPHPPLEVVFTVDEETGLLGAEGIDLSMLKGKKLLNIDSDEEGIFLTSCAGGLDVDCRIPMAREAREGICYEIKVSGLKGGHSGMEIHKERGNAIFLMGRVLEALGEAFPCSIVALEGGLKDNAIPREAACTILLGQEGAPFGQEKAFLELAGQIGQTLRQEYRSSDPGLTVMVRDFGQGCRDVLDDASQEKALCLMRQMPCGVQHWSMEVEGLVETSANPGILKLSDGFLSLCCSVRSNVTSRKYEVAKRLGSLVSLLGGESSLRGDYPAWEYQPDSPVRELLADTYRELFGEEPKKMALHAGLECGIFTGKIKGLDCISFGPDNFDIHTPMERLSIPSVAKVWELILGFLERSK